MDPSFVLQALQYSVGRTQQEVSLAEKYLAEMKYSEGYLQSLLLIACDPNVNSFVRQAAAVYLKTTIMERWKNEDRPISPNEKQIIKESILDAIIKCSESSRLYKQIHETIRYIGQRDFPENWQSIYGNILNNLRNKGDYNHIFGSLLALKGLVYNYKFLAGKDRLPLELIVQETFPLLEVLLKAALSNHNNHTADNILYVIFKIFYICVYGLIPKYLMQENQLQVWLIYLQEIVERPLPPELESYTTDARILDQREVHTAWLSKKNGVKILNLFVYKYADIRQVKDENKAFPDFFLPKYAGFYLEGFLNFLYKHKRSYIHPSTHYFAIKYVTNSLNYRNLDEIFISQIEPILYDLIIPALSLTPNDEEDWVNNPLEFIRNRDSPGYNQSPMAGSKYLIERMISKKIFTLTEEKQILPRFFEFAAHVLVNSTNLRDNVQADYRLKEAVIHTLGLFQSLIIFSEELSDKMAFLLEKVLIPDFKNTQGPLKYRLCWLFGYYGGLEFQSIENVLALSDALYGCLCQDELPIRVEAGIALNSVFQNKEARLHIRPHLDKILMCYVTLIDSIDNENLTQAFERVISKFEDCIQPYAIDLIKYLTKAFVKADQDGLQSASLLEISEKEGVAEGFLSTIIRILSSSLPKEIIYETKNILMPVMEYILKNEKSDNIELGLKIFNLLLLNLPELDQDIWQFFPLLNYLIVGTSDENKFNEVTQIPENFPEGFQAQLLKVIEFNGLGEEYVSGIVPCFIKYIQKDKGVIFVAKDPYYNITYLELMLKSIDKVYEICNDSENDVDMVRITSVLIMLIESYPQQLSSEILKYALSKALENIVYPKSIVMEKMLLQIVAVCLWRDTNLTLQFLEYNNSTELVFKKWIDRFPDFQHIFEFKRVLVGLSCLLRIDFSQLPQVISASIKGFFLQMIHLAIVIAEMRENNLKTFKLSNTEAFRRPDEDEYQEDVYDYEVDGLWEPEEEYHSILLDACELSFFKENLEVLKNNQNAIFVELMSTINPQHLAKLHTIFENISLSANPRT